MSLRIRIDHLEDHFGTLDTDPTAIVVRSLGNRPFTAKALSLYVRHTQPGHAHPVRELIAAIVLEETLSHLDPPGAVADAEPRESILSPEQMATTSFEEQVVAIVRIVDDLIVGGHFEWLADAVKEWERLNPNPRNGINVLP